VQSVVEGQHLSDARRNRCAPRSPCRPRLRGASYAALPPKPVSADIRTRLRSGERIPPGKGSARPETGAARLGSLGRFRAAETTLSRVSSDKATESQRLFRWRQESGFARDCVVGLVGARPASDIKALPSHTPAKATTDRKEQLATVTHPPAHVEDTRDQGDSGTPVEQCIV
jgi:hypothetical protein